MLIDMNNVIKFCKLIKMSRDYFKSQEGLAEYEKIGWPYPEEIYDKNYETFLKLTKNTKGKDYKIYIRNMKRYMRFYV